MRSEVQMEEFSENFIKTSDPFKKPNILWNCFCIGSVALTSSPAPATLIELINTIV